MRSKMMVAVLTASLVGVFLSVFPAPAAAQVWDDRDAFFGEGTARFQGRVETLVRAGIRRDGDNVEVRLRTADGDVIVVEGRLRRDTGQGVEMDVRSVNGREAASGMMFAGTKGRVDTLGTVQIPLGRAQFSATFRPDERAAGANRPTPVLTLSESGGGSISLQGRRPQDVTRASVSTKRDGRAEVTVQGAAGLTLRFAGNVVRSDANSMTIRVNSSGNADATGGLDLEYSRNRLRTLSGSGTLDGQKYRIRFDATAFGNTGGSDLTLTQQGHGILDLEGRKRSQLRSASISVRRDNSAEMQLRRDDGTVLSFSGRVTQRDAYSLRIAIRSSGQADAVGSANVSYGARGAINTINAHGQLDGQSFYVYFAK